MKRTPLLFVVIIFLGMAARAQDTSAYNMLNHYYAIKEALVEGDTKLAAQKAGEFIKATNVVDDKVVDAATAKKLVDNANIISANPDLKKQREAFSPFSDDMYALAKKVKMSKAPVYRQYCPMKKAYWLSSEQVIRNPYYGSMMLNCGKVMETIASK